MDSIIVTGASGFIGKTCVRHLLEMGLQVHAISHKSNSPPFSGARLNWHKVDLLDAKQTSSFLKNVRAKKLLHFAWYAEPGKFWNSNLNEDWLAASIHLVKEFAAAGGERFVGAGTCAEYDWTGGSGVLSEFQTELKPATLYGKCKMNLFSSANEFCVEAGISFAWGRIFWLYGQEEDERRFVPYVITSLLSGTPAKCTSGVQKRDYMHVDDVARAFAALVQSDLRGPINIASGNAVMVKEIAEAIGDRLGHPELIKLNAIQTSTNESPLLVANVERLSKELGFQPRITLADGLQDAVTWWQEKKSATSSK